jgi:hypothetical protein
MIEQSMTELLSSYNKTFLEVHGYRAPYFPPTVTHEWLLDQLHALQWYARYEHALMGTRAEEAEKRKPKEVVQKKRKVEKKVNPFI